MVTVSKHNDAQVTHKGAPKADDWVSADCPCGCYWWGSLSKHKPPKWVQRAAERVSQVTIPQIRAALKSEQVFLDYLCSYQSSFLKGQEYRDYLLLYGNPINSRVAIKEAIRESNHWIETLQQRLKNLSNQDGE
jgi:hypothetical protein